jgi:GTP pyrophosphokinase
MILDHLSKSGLKVEVYGRSKHLWSIYRKMQMRNIEYEQVYDVLAFRLIVQSVSDCYEALGHIHSIWKPIPGRFKDFIAMPKANNYQSLHTTVIGPGGERIEIQIRTVEMNLVAEKGIAAHWKYKERGKILDDVTTQQSHWLRDLVAWHQQVRTPEEFLDTIKTDLFESEIYVFTPNGDVKEFPEGASPVDFAYAVHTELGNKCMGARINGKMVPLKYKMQNGDTVEIVTSKTQVPSKDWLKFVVTNKAKSKIRQFVKEEQRKRSLELGKELLDKEFRKFGMQMLKNLKSEETEKFLKDNGLSNVDELFIRVGYGKLEPKHLVERFHPSELEKESIKNEESTFMEKVLRSATQKTRKSNSLVMVEGMDNMLVHYARCCNPIPGDSIVGFISRGRGVTVHRSDCRRAFAMDQMRKVDVAWTSASAGKGQERAVRLEVVSQDVPGLLKLMSEAFAIQGINIQSAQIKTTKDKKAICMFEVSVTNSSQLDQAIFELQKIRGIIGVNRILNGY